jgi:hypothetical protein
MDVDEYGQAGRSVCRRPDIHEQTVLAPRWRARRALGAFASELGRLQCRRPGSRRLWRLPAQRSDRRRRIRDAQPLICTVHSQTADRATAGRDIGTGSARRGRCIGPRRSRSHSGRRDEHDDRDDGSETGHRTHPPCPKPRNFHDSDNPLSSKARPEARDRVMRSPLQSYLRGSTVKQVNIA